MPLREALAGGSNQCVKGRTMNQSGGNPVTQINLTKSTSAGRRGLRSAPHLTGRKKVHIPGLGAAEQGRPRKAEALSMEDLPIALRIAAVTRHRGGGSFSDLQLQCDVATREKELIDGLVRVLSRGHERRVRS